jgi:probable selenium-dependent hydroxylase accessory protein YqeC
VRETRISETKRDGMILVAETARKYGWTYALGLGPHEHVAIVGGGGKTSLCFALAEELAGAGKRVIITTTTKVWRKEADRAPCVIFAPSGSAASSRVKAGLRETACLFVAQRPLDSGKVEGISPETADALFQEMHTDCLIVEADGAAGRPLKAPASHEPVIPPSATLVIAVMGLEALGMRLDPQMVFRPDIFRDVSGLAEGDLLSTEAIARVFQSPKGLFKGTPEVARRIVFLNKSDRLRPDQDPEALARRLTGLPGLPIDRVIIGSLSQGVCRVCMRDDQEHVNP